MSSPINSHFGSRAILPRLSPSLEAILICLQERRNHLFGRISAYKALLQSSALLRSNASVMALWPDVLNSIYKIAQDVPWLREECGMMLCNFVKALATAESQADAYLNVMLSSLKSHELSKTPEGIAIWITIKSHFPTFELPSKIWRKNDPLCTKERATLVKAMTGTMPQEPVDAEANGEKVTGKGKKGKAPKVKMGTWQHNPHFAWNLVLQEAITTMPKASKFQQFWIEVVDSE
jgi:DNA polymerase phi